MDSNRLETFSDGVLAIIITIMVLEMKAPEESSIEALIAILPKVISYVVSFIYIGTCWNNHHHLFKVTSKINGKILWSNLHLLFWLSLIPFATSWVGDNHIEKIPVALYGLILLMCAIAFKILRNQIIQGHTENSALLEHDETHKGIISFVLYGLGIVSGFWYPYLGILCYVLVLAIWFFPINELSKVLTEQNDMEIGIDSFAATPNGHDDSVRAIHELLERIELADKVGLHCFGIGEHYRKEFLDAAPATILAAAAARTKNIKLASAVTVLSTSDPVRVFQNFQPSI